MLSSQSYNRVLGFPHHFWLTAAAAPLSSQTAAGQLSLLPQERAEGKRTAVFTSLVTSTCFGLQSPPISSSQHSKTSGKHQVSEGWSIEMGSRMSLLFPFPWFCGRPTLQERNKLPKLCNEVTHIHKPLVEECSFCTAFQPGKSLWMFSTYRGSSAGKY